MTVRRVSESGGSIVPFSFSKATSDGVSLETQRTVVDQVQPRGALTGRDCRHGTPI